MLNRCHIGDCRAVLRELAGAGLRAQTCVTSPPYWGLRDYGVDGQIGLEASLDEWVATMVEVFRAVRDVLTDDGTLWLNLGDAYAGTGAGWQGKQGDRADRRHTQSNLRPGPSAIGLKPKDLMGQPWRVAFALQADGWYLRKDIIWHKLNPMPESVTDRPTTSHEYVFLLSKSERYYYDAEAIKEPASLDTHARYARANGGQPRTDETLAARGFPSGWAAGPGSHSAIEHAAKDAGRKEQGLRDSSKFGRGAGWRRKLAEAGSGTKANESMDAAMRDMPDMRNKRSVWPIATEPYSEAHFATFPRKLVEPCILAGSRPGDVVLDPFLGSGTVASVAERLGREWLGCELNPDYLPMIEGRLKQRALALE